MNFTREIVKVVSLSAPKFNVKELAKRISEHYSVTPAPEVKQKKSFSPSLIGYGHGTCPRYWHLAFRGESVFEDTFDGMARANMRVGTETHERLQETLRELGVVSKIEQRIELESPPVIGSVDAVLNVDGVEVVAEIKSTRQEGYAARSNSMRPPSNHLYQILLYMHTLGIKDGLMIYENKNDQSLLLLPVNMGHYEESILQDALAWMEKVYGTHVEGKLATRPHSKIVQVCKSCPVMESCWSKDAPEGDVKISKMTVAKP